MFDCKCPFFKHEKNGAIGCEFARITPPDKQAMDDFVEAHCGNHEDYKYCEFYRIMDAYYARKYKDWQS